MRQLTRQFAREMGVGTEDIEVRCLGILGGERLDLGVNTSTGSDSHHSGTFSSAGSFGSGSSRGGHRLGGGSSRSTSSASDYSSVNSQRGGQHLGGTGSTGGDDATQAGSFLRPRPFTDSIPQNTEALTDEALEDELYS